MKLILPTIAALVVVAFPCSTHGWNMGRPYTPMLLHVSPASIMLERQGSLAKRMLDQTGFSSPRYELVDDENKFQLSVDVPGVQEEDIDVQLDDGFLTVKGQRTSSSESSRFLSRFSQTFSLDPSVDVEQFSAHLNNGVLVVTAPKNMKRLEESVRRIPITTDAEAFEDAAQPSPEATDDYERNQEANNPVSDPKKDKEIKAIAAEEDDAEEIDLDV
ncbi:HSP20-like chaperone [Nitzschia inconspicua]|uniref:HSP20-like chaperone n=1 Tax=Nitzschia inconspicua TaxID=303405 RepID=A0A9K3LU23_9STRA|nr:HSP20-like chaperone [Nitzschia inconspicua]